MKVLVVLIILLASLGAMGSSVKPEDVGSEMDKYLSHLGTKSGWQDFMKTHLALCGNVDEKNPSFVGVDKLNLTVKGEEVSVGLSCRSVYINAAPKTIAAIADDPRHFQALFGLDKSAEMGPKNSDGSYEARVFKLVPGIETQDYTLAYNSHWEDETWIARAKQTKDEHAFAIRDNAKMVEPSGAGAIHREAVLFFPERWWMKLSLIDGFVQSVTNSELKKINMALKCAAEKVPLDENKNPKMTDEIARTCHKEAEKS